MSTKFFTDEEFYKCKNALMFSYSVEPSVKYLTQVYFDSFFQLFKRLESYNETSPARFHHMHSTDEKGNIVLSNLAKRSLQRCGRTDTIELTMEYCENIVRPEANYHPAVKQWATVLLRYIRSLPTIGTEHVCSNCGKSIAIL